ncbi:MAG: pyridoxal-phosphate dependent enzyme [Actinobacteria bacterium]|nr:pyridoxal-phosphate dependent enzyme [Actinomycetota bacterium]
MVTRDDVERAAAVIAGQVHRTPVLRSQSLGPGCWLKAELFQKTGSFKPRGVLNALAALTPEERGRGVISVSAGNHAQALAWGAREAGIDALLVMWAGASEAKIAATRGYGAAVDLAASGPSEAFPRLRALAAETGRTLVHPFDDPRVMAGQGTVGLEILEDVPGVDTIVVGVGGGGLVSGIAAACEGTGVRVVAVEPEGSTALHSGLLAGRSVPVEPRSLADALNAPFAGEGAVAVCAARGVEVVLVSEEEICEAFRFLYARAKLACEPGAAAATAAVLAGRVAGESVAVVVSGGNVSAETASGILNRR